MRVTLLLTAMLALAACGKNDQANSVQNAGDSLTAEDIVSNDVTAIDAVTGDAANMAMDVDMNFGSSADNQAVSGGEPANKSTHPSRPPTKAARAQDSTATSNSTTTNTVTNSD